MKKVGILTFYYNVKNYGAMLQAFALRETIARLGYECKQISYDRFMPVKSTSQQIKEYVHNKRFVKLIRKGTIVVKRKLQHYFIRELDERNRLFHDFMLSIPHTIPYTDETIHECLGQFDAFVCGSDQIWNPEWSNSIFFLEFVDSARKIAYAASIGLFSITEAYKQTLVKAIKRFDAVSFREQQFIEELSSLTGKKINCVLDPTMLLERADYEKLCTNTSVDCNYAFVYLLGSNKRNIKMAKFISKKKGLKIAYIPYVGNFGLNDKKHSDFLLLDVGPKEFLGLIKNSKAVITDSFHACVFSIIFHKDFYCLERKENLHKPIMGNRLTTLLNNFSLQDRLLKSYNGYREIDSIDYEAVDIKLNKLRKSSMDFLKWALDGEEEAYDGNKRET